MTTLVVVRKAGTAVIAADTQTTFGDTRLMAEYDAGYHKIFKTQDTYFGICGSAAHDLVLQSALKNHADLAFNSRSAIFDTFCRLHPILKDQFFLNPKEDEEDPYESSQMTLLLVNPHGIFGVFSMREVYEYTKFWAIGSGREYALGAMHAAYAQDLNAEEIARIGIEAGATFDIHSSLPLLSYSLQLTDKLTA